MKVIRRESFEFPATVLGESLDGPLLWDLAQTARLHLLKSFLGEFDIQTKTSRSDYVTSVDLSLDDLIRKRLSVARPEDALLTEESGEFGSADRRWIIDPLDGTANFSRGRPNWCTSIALTIGGVSVLGAVVEPLADRVYLAVEGKGAWSVTPGKVRRLQVSAQQALQDAVGAVGFSNSPEIRRRQAQHLATISNAVLDVRPYGSAALDLCHVADGTHDFYYEDGLSVWDFAAGVLIVREAGGSILVDGQTVLATNRFLTQALNNSILQADET